MRFPVKVRVKFVPADAWIGAYFDRPRARLYVCLIPCFPIVFYFADEAAASVSSQIAGMIQALERDGPGVPIDWTSVRIAEGHMQQPAHDKTAAARMVEALERIRNAPMVLMTPGAHVCGPSDEWTQEYVIDDAPNERGPLMLVWAVNVVGMMGGPTIHRSYLAALHELESTLGPKEFRPLSTFGVEPEDGYEVTIKAAAMRRLDLDDLPEFEGYS